METTWLEFKNFVDSRNLSIQYITLNNNYYLKAFDGPFELSCLIPLDSSNSYTQDFESNYKSQGNQKLQDPKDADGVLLHRLKVTAAGWALNYHGIEFTTSKLNPYVNKNENNQCNSFCSSYLYDANGELITLAENEINCTKTVIDWEPTFNYDIVGGQLFQPQAPTTNIRISVIGVPDIPKENGGSKLFMSGFNLKFIGSNELLMDGKTPKSLIYSPAHTNKLRFIFHHDAGVVHSVLCMLMIFKA